MKSLTRRDALAGTAAVVGVTTVTTALAASTPQERIEHHVEGIKQAFREMHPDMEGAYERVLLDLEPEPREYYFGSMILIAAEMGVAS